MQIFINNILIFTKHLPFSITGSIDDLNEVGFGNGFTLANFTGQMIILPTENAKVLFANVQQNQVFTIKVTSKYGSFSGIFTFSETVYENDRITGFIGEVFAGEVSQKQIFQSSLRSLDLGNIVWNLTNISDTWVGDYTNKVIFAPVIYGDLTSGTNDWIGKDLRPHVYFDAILEGIVTALGVTLDFELRSSHLWRSLVYVFGVGKAMKAVGGLTFQSVLSTSDYFIQMNFPSNEGIFDFRIEIPSGGSAQLKHINVTTSEGYDEDFTYTGEVLNVYLSLEIGLGGFLRIEGHQTGHSHQNLPLFSNITAELQKTASFGSNIIISSCLHDIPIYEWLDNVFKMICLVSFYNPILKVWTIRPRQKVTIDGINYEGFYPEIFEGHIEPQLEVTKSDVSLKGSFLFGYAPEPYTDVANTIDAYNPNSTIPSNCAKFVINANSDNEDLRTRFAHLPQGFIQSKVLAGTLPVCLTKDTEFERIPTVAIVTDAHARIFYYGVDTVVPRLGTYNFTKGYSISYGDLTVKQNATTYVIKGLLSIFFDRWLNNLKNYEQINTNAAVYFSFESFRKIYKIKNKLYILSSVSIDFDKQLNEMTFFRYTERTEALSVINSCFETIIT